MPKRTPEQWQQLLSEYQKSGLTQKAFCEQKNICPKGLIRHKRKVSESLPSTPSFVQVTRTQPMTTDTINVELGGLRIYLPLSQPLQVAQLLKALQ